MDWPVGPRGTHEGWGPRCVQRALEKGASPRRRPVREEAGPRCPKVELRSAGSPGSPDSLQGQEESEWSGLGSEATPRFRRLHLPEPAQACAAASTGIKCLPRAEGRLGGKQGCRPGMALRLLPAQILWD